MNAGSGDTPYVPVDCGFHDRLLALATLRRVSEVVYLDDQGLERSVEARIEDVYSRAGAEFARLSGGEIVRLDRLVRVAGHARPGTLS